MDNDNNSQQAAITTDNKITQANKVDRVRPNVLLFALFATAFSSLAYELVWCRKLSYVFGSTALAASTILAIFMGGLALGSLYGGRILESRKKPFAFLAKLLCSIGMTCIFTLFAIKWAASLQSYLINIANIESFFVIKGILFLLAGLVLLLPTFLIGVAFPCIVHLYHTKNTLVGQSISRCYWVDTLGASLGMLVAAFYLAPNFGFFKTSIVASVINIASGILIFVCLSDKNNPINQPGQNNSKASTSGKFETKVVSFLFFLSGFAALILEITWIRHFTLIYGGGLHAFAIVVVCFLLGLSIGSFIYEKFLKNIANQVLLFCSIELGIGAVSIIITATFPHMERLFLDLYFGSETFFGLMLTVSMVCFAVLLLPTILMGMTLPAICAVNVSGIHIGKDFGRLYAANSLGALAGSFGAGFLIIPALGIYNCSYLACGIYVFIALAFLYCFYRPGFPLKRTMGIFAIIIVAVFGLFSSINIPDHLYNGVFYTGTVSLESPQKSIERYFKQQERDKKFLRYLKNGIYGQVAVTGTKTDLVIRTNGKIDSTTGQDVAGYQSMLGHAPAIIHDNPENVLNIGMGFCWTVNALTNHPAVKTIDCVEINPLVVEVNRTIFFQHNRDILNNPKVNTIVNDGRNYLENTRKKYQVIISEPTDLSTSGISALFTKEFYLSASNSLTDDGILCQWFPRYEISELDYKIIINTIKSIFPYVNEFDISKITGERYYQSFMIFATKNPVDIEKVLKERKDALQEQNPYHQFLAPALRVVGSAYNRNNEAMEQYITDTNIINSDDLPILEFHGLKDRFRKFREN